MRLLLAVPFLLAACVPTTATPPAPSTPTTTRSPLAVLFAPARDYRIGTLRGSDVACSGAYAIDRYQESMEYIDLPPILFGLNAEGCIQEIRVDYAEGAGRYDHAVSLVTQRLGAPDGEDRATCTATGALIQTMYWMQPEGRFEVVRADATRSPEFVLRSAEAPFDYRRLCEGGVTRE